VIGVLSANDGMGRTAAAVQLAGALAARTGQLTVAVDAHPVAGSLSERLAPSQVVTAADLLVLIDHPKLTREELCGFLSWHGPCLGLLPSRRDRGPPLAARDWRRLLGGLVRHGLTLVVDCPPGPSPPATRAVAAAADQLLLLVEPQPSAASRRMARALADQGRPPLAVTWPAEIGRVADTLVADWPALGLAAPSTATRGGLP
jgi:MinD-like ATPase involved in chromosome partitioning or flagellar assembly